MFEGIKDKLVYAAPALPVGALLAAAPAFAETVTVTSAVSTAATTIASDATTMITTVAPISIGVVGAGIVLRIGIKYLRLMKQV